MAFPEVRSLEGSDRPRDTLLGAFTLMRPANSLMVGFAVVVGIATVEPSKIVSIPSLLGFLTGFTISAYSMVVNDYYDLEVDVINAPGRPLPSGSVSRRFALALALSLLGAGLIFSYFNGIAGLFIAAVFSWIAWLYNAWGKKKGLLGNFMVSASVAIPYIYGGIAIQASNNLVWFLALTSFLASVGREVVKAMTDIQGDEVRGINSIARVYGEGFAARVGASFFFAAVLSTALPVTVGLVGFFYTILILIPNAIFIYLGIVITRSKKRESARRVKKLALVGMLAGLIVFVVEGVLRG